jgi:hypothetical protein
MQLACLLVYRMQCEFYVRKINVLVVTLLLLLYFYFYTAV